MGKSTRARKGQVFSLAVLLALLALIGVGCGGSDSSSSTSGSTTPAEGGTTEGTSGGGDFAALEEFIAEYEQEPTKIAATRPLASKPKPGETIIFLQCAVTQCTQQGIGIKDAVESVGWNVETANYDSADPSTLITQLNEALTKDPAAVVFSGSPEEIWAQVIPDYEKAGVALIPMFIGPAKLEGPVIANIAGELENEIAGKLLADWFIVDSEGSGTALIQAVPGFPAITIWVEYFEEEVAKECPACSVEVVESSLEELGDGSSTQTMLSALQRNGDARYVISYNGAFIAGLPTEAQNAGLPEIKVGTYASTGDYVAEAARGKDYGLILLSNIYTGWIATNAALLNEEGVAMKPEEELLPIQLATKDSATQELAESANSFTAPADFQEQFKQLWGAG